jgi:hypothetical protein
MSDGAMKPLEASLDGLIAAVDRQNDEGSILAWGLEAIKDIQGTIRAIDSKIGILLAALAFPLKDVAEQYVSRHGSGVTVVSIVLTLAIIFYGLGILLSVLTLSGIGGAHFHASGSSHFNTFYAPGLFKLRVVDAIFRRGEVRSSMTVKQFADEIPKTCEGMILDLSAEIMQLAYIRDLKLIRQRFAFIFTGSAFLLGFLGALLR